jgi:single-strand DNA-binding protein
MSEGINRVYLFGNLGADPELRFTSAGKAVLHFRLATNESYVDSDGVRREITHWHRAVLWGKRAEALSKILRQGSCVMVEGQLRTSSYEKNGEKRYSTEVHVRDLCLAPGRARTARNDDGPGLPASALDEAEGRKSHLAAASA